MHRINYLTFSPFCLNYINKKIDDSSEKKLKEKENEDKLFKMIKFDYNNYEFNEDLLFNICNGFVDIDKLKEENLAGKKAAKNSIILDLDLFKNNDKTDNSLSKSKSNSIEENPQKENEQEGQKNIEEILTNEINELIEAYILPHFDFSIIIKKRKNYTLI